MPKLKDEAVQELDKIRTELVHLAEGPLKAVLLELLARLEAVEEKVATKVKSAFGGKSGNGGNGEQEKEKS